MSFVLPMLLGGLALAGIPVLLHLIMRQKPKHLLFPAMRFLMVRHRTNQRKLQLRHLLLLALRILLIAAICLALARPRIFSERLNILSGRPMALVLVFDTSYSMEYVYADKSRLEEAKRRALELFDDLPEGSRVAVLDTGLAEGEWVDPSSARERINALKLQPASASVTSRLPQAYDLLDKIGQDQEKPEEAPLPFLCVLSDRTQTSWDAGQLENLQHLHNGLAGRVHSVFVDLGVDDPTDRAITDVELPRQVIPANDKVVLRATVQMTGESGEMEVLCRIDGQEPPERKALKLEAGKSEVVSFERRGLAEGWHQVEITLPAADKNLPFDNAAFATFYVRGSRKLLVIADNEADARFWKAALQIPSELGVFTCDVKATAVALKEFFPEEARKEYQVVFLLSVADPDPELWKKLDSYVQNGGGLGVIAGGSELQLEAYNSAVAQRLLPASLVKLVSVADKEGVDWDWKNNPFQHPLMKPFQDWRRAGNLDFEKFPPGAFRYWQVQPHDSSIPAFYDTGEKPPPAALLERLLDRQTGSGRVLLFTTPLDGRKEYNNYLQFTSFYLVLAQLTANYLAGDAEDGNFNHLCGQAVPVMIPATARFPTYTIQGPGLSGTEAAVSRAENQNELLLTQPVLFGNYTLFGADGKPVARFSLKMPPEECQLARVPPEQVESLFGSDSVLAPDRKISLKKALQEHWSQPVELLPYLLILLLLVLAVENLLANKFYRRPQGDSLDLSKTSGVPS